MSETLSALIAFVGFLILFSMIVQSAQEAVKNILKLRVGVWERFFINLYSGKLALGDIKYTERIKMYGKRAWAGSLVGEFDVGLSRLKGTLSTANNLLKTLKKSLQSITEIDPRSAEALRQISYHIQPFLEALQQFSGLKLDKNLSILVEKFNQTELTELYSQVTKFEKAYPDIGKIMQAGKVYSKVYDINDFQNTCKDLLSTIEKAEKKISEYWLQFEHNIDSWIGQMNEEYRRNMLKWTVVLGFVFVISANADSFSIYQYLHSDTKAQTAIAEKVKDIKELKQTTDPEDLNKILATLKENKVQEAQKLSVDFLAKLETDYHNYGAGGEADKVKELKESVEKIGISNKEEGKKRLQEEHGKITAFYIKLPQVAIENQMRGLTELELPLGWTSDHKKYDELTQKKRAEKRAKGSAGDAAKEYNRFIASKIGGLLLTTILITFGSPFWNDILGAITGLKNITQKK